MAKPRDMPQTSKPARSPAEQYVIAVDFLAKAQAVLARNLEAARSANQTRRCRGLKRRVALGMERLALADEAIRAVGLTPAQAIASVSWASGIAQAVERAVPDPNEEAAIRRRRRETIERIETLMADPDAQGRKVWIFRTGSMYHRSDCHVVDARDGAVEIRLADAKRKGLQRCRHCAPDR